MNTECEHSVGNDPRYSACVKCGRTIDGRWARDKGRERLLALRASKDVEHTENLVRFAQSRSGDTAVRFLRSRNFHREVREELGDALNYMLWMDDSKFLQDGTGLNAGELACLHHITEAWRWLHIGGDDE